MARPPVRERTSAVWTLPNIISTVRLAGVPLFLWLVIGPEADVWALVVLMVAAIPFRYAATSVSPLWLLEAAMLLLVGIVTAERIYCRLASTAALATTVQMIAYPGARLLGLRLGGAAPDRAPIDG